MFGLSLLIFTQIACGQAAPQSPNAWAVEDDIANGDEKGIPINKPLQPQPTMLSPARITVKPTATINSARLPDPAVTTSAVTPDDSLWYGFDRYVSGDSPPHGLYRLKNGEITHFDIPATIRVLEAGPDGSLYVGAGCGVMRFRDEAWEMLMESDCDQPSSLHKFVLDFAFAEDGTLWAGDPYSLASYRDGSWTEFDIHAARVEIAPDGTIWARGWDGRSNSNCCVTQITRSQWLTYTWSADIPAEPELLRELFDQPDYLGP